MNVASSWTLRLFCSSSETYMGWAGVTVKAQTHWLVSNWSLLTRETPLDPQPGQYHIELWTVYFPPSRICVWALHYQNVGGKSVFESMDNTYERQKASLRTKWLRWSFLLSASRSVYRPEIAGFSGIYFAHTPLVTDLSSSQLLFRARDDSISTRTRKRSRAQVSNSSTDTSKSGGIS